ncbi:MAG: hypothetical protein ABGY95_04275 [Rubritalea sp.]|uniref:hypothetical protein n=1 Tax=Rubritalea sp. TaxID=2109375 RepID=UPI003242F439
MNRFVILLISLMSCASLHAIDYKNLLEEPPASDSPAGAFVFFQKAAAKGDLERMYELSTGTVYRVIKESEESRANFIERAKDIDWKKPIEWAQKVEGDTAKVAFRYRLVSNGRRSGHTVDFSKVDGKWKYGK